MRITFDIPERLYRSAEVRASRNESTIPELILAALAKDLDDAPADEPHFKIDELGLPRLNRAEDDPTVITEAFVNRLREQEGI